MTPQYTPHDVTILVPMLGRPHHVEPLLESIDATTPDAAVLFLCTPGDSAVPACIGTGRPVLTVPWEPVGDFGRKINAGYRATLTPLLFVGASDLEFQPGWFEAAVAELGPGVGVVGTNDLCNPRVMAGQHATHFLVTREYADQYGTVDGPGAVLAEVYPHEYVDTEAVGTAMHRGAWAHAPQSIVKHLHGMCGQGYPEDADDPLYAAQRERMQAGWPIFRRRRMLWSPSHRRRLRASPVKRR